MELDKAILQLYPDTNFITDVQLFDAGEGPFIRQWNRPEPQPTPAQLETAWQAWLAGEPGRVAKEEEIREAPGIARGWFATHQAAINFIRLSPAEQEAQIDAMTLAQLRTVVKYLTIAVAMIIKRELLP